MPTQGEQWIKLDVNMPDHSKIEGLSDKAFRLLIDTWCWAGRMRNDGCFTKATWGRRGTRKSRGELELAGLVRAAKREDFDEISPKFRRSDEVDQYVVLHDFLYWQRSRAEIEERSTKRSRSGSIGNHTRWHVRKHRVDPDCSYCQADAEGDRTPVASAIANPSQVRSQVRSHRESLEKRSTSSGYVDLERVSDQRAREDRQEAKEDPPTRPRNGRPRDLGEPPERGCSKTAYKIVRDWAEGRAPRPPAARLTRLGVEIDRLLAEDWSEIDIVHGLDRLDEKRLGPAQLSSIVYELAKADAAPRSPLDVPEDQLTEADVEALIGSIEHDLDWPLMPGDLPEQGRDAMQRWRDTALPAARARRLERAKAERRRLLAKIGKVPS